MVRKKTLILSMVMAALLMSVIHVNPGDGSHYAGSNLFVYSFEGITGMSVGTFAGGMLIEYGIFLLAVYLLFRGVSKRFGR
jgi:hypothetical protein